MRRFFLAVAMGSVALSFASPAFAASPFDGTWKMDIKAAKYDPKPDVMVLKDGVFDCQTCTPPYKLAADGKVHAVAGRDYADAMSMTVVDASTVTSASYKGGEKYAETTRTVSPDGALVTVNWRSSLNPEKAWKSGVTTLQRTGPAPAGAHALSGSWVPTVTEATKMPADAGILTFAVDGDTFNFKTKSGESYAAQFGGPAVPVVGDPTGGTVTVKRVGDAIEETMYVKGKPVTVNTMTVVDASTIKIMTKDLRAGFNDEMILRKQ